MLSASYNFQYGREILYQATNNNHRIRRIIMLPSRNNVKFLPRAPIAGFQLHRDQILPKVACKRIDGEALTVSRFQGCGGESSGGCGVPNIGGGGGSGIEDTACTGDGDGLEGGILTRVERLFGERTGLDEGRGKGFFFEDGKGGGEGSGSEEEGGEGGDHHCQER